MMYKLCARSKMLNAEMVVLHSWLYFGVLQLEMSEHLLFLLLNFVVIGNQVARAGRFGTKGLAITFVSDENDAKILNDVQERFEVNITELPDEIDISSYSKCQLFSILHGLPLSILQSLL